MINAHENIQDAVDTSRKIGFPFLITCYILAFATQGFGDFRIAFINESFSTYFIYLAFIFQFVTRKLRFPKLLLGIYLYIFIQSYVFNLLNINIASSASHFLGFILFSLSIFSFLSVYRNRILDVVRIYYKFVFGVVCFVFLQTALFIFFGLSFKPQQILWGSVIANMNNPFVVAMLNFLPRAVGLSTEPTHYAIIILPGVYLALLVLIGKGSQLKLESKKIAVIILIGVILSFSLVGYFGLFLCLISIFASKSKGKLIVKAGLAVFFLAFIYIISSSSLMYKLNKLPTMFSEGIESYEYTTSDLSGFALASNLLVARESLKKSHYLGTGFNTHKDSYDREIYRIFSESQVIMELNRTGAGSLYIRILSEFGIPGILIFFYFIFHFWIRKAITASPLKYINNMSLMMIICYCTREESYINIYLSFFMALSYYTFISWRKKGTIIYE